MAYKSFVLRSTSTTSTTKGSYLQYPAGSEAASVGLTVREYSDTRLRSDETTATTVDETTPLIPIVTPVLSDPIIPGNEIAEGRVLTKVAYFQSQVLDYNEIELSWGAPLASDITITPQPTRVIINYSDIGEPQTVSEGLTIVDSDTVSEIRHFPESGRWAYYTLFIKYESRSVGASTNINTYYEKGASLAELMPYNYGCTNDMYSKIPEYYRLLDGNLDTGNGGPLYRMISMFGFEADRVRTTIDYLIASKDPLFAHSEILDVLSKDLSLGIRVDELGTAVLRELLNNIGNIRRSLGTPIATKSAVEAITGSYVDIDSDNNVIKVYAQRANLFKDPDIYSGAKGSFAGGSPYTSGFATELETGGASVPSVTANYSGGDPYSSLTTIDEFPLDPAVNPSPFDDPSTFNELWSYFPDPATGGSTTVLQISEPYVYVKGGETLTFSIQGSLYTNAQDTVTRIAFYGIGEGAASAGYTGLGDSSYSVLDGKTLADPYTSTVDAEGAADVTRDPTYDGGTDASIFFDDILIAESSSPITIGGIKYWNITIPDSVTEYTPVFFAAFIGPNANLLKGFARLLLERSSAGEYFDGSSVNGGWLIEGPPTLQRTNLITNPSFEVNLNGWSVVPGAGYTAGGYRYTDSYYTGLSSARVQIASGTGGGNVDFKTAAESTEVIPNKDYTFSAYVKVNIPRPTRVAIVWYDSLGSVISTSAGSFTSTTPGVWVRRSVTATSPSNAVTCSVTCSYGETSALSGEFWLWDSALLEQSSTVGNYFDGSSYVSGGGYTYADNGWLGIPNDSESGCVEYGGRVSDYRWYYDPEPSSPVLEGEEEKNYSVYNSNYQKKRALMNRYIKELIPVNQLSTVDTVHSNDDSPLTTPNWVVNWNAIPGVPYTYTLPV